MGGLELRRAAREELPHCERARLLLDDEVGPQRRQHPRALNSRHERGARLPRVLRVPALPAPAARARRRRRSGPASGRDRRRRAGRALAALGLASHGVRSVVIEADDAVCYGSRAICISRRSLEIFDRLGVCADVLGEALPWTGGRSFYRDCRGAALADAAGREPEAAADGEPRSSTRRADPARPCRSVARLVEIRWQTKPRDLDAGDDGVALDLDARRRGDYALRADWVVACDGGRSAVREALGLQVLRHDLRRHVHHRRHPAEVRPPDRAAAPGSTRRPIPARRS